MDPPPRAAATNELDLRHAPNGATFTLQDLWHAVEETERRTRGQTTWFGGIDVHHVHFEGLHAQEDGGWTIAWGS